MVKRNIEQDIRNKNFGVRNGNKRRTSRSRTKGQNSVHKELLEIVGNGKPTGSALKETIAVSVTVEKLHHQIRLRILSCSRMSENNREPEVPEVKIPAVECLDGHARITLKELAPIQSVQSVNSTSPITDLFIIVLRNDDIQEFDSKWDGTLFIVYDKNPTS